MAPRYDLLRVRLIQIRDLPTVEAEERESFRTQCRLHPTQLVCTNVLHEALPLSLLNHIDALLIGGAGSFSAKDDYDWTPALADLVLACADQRLPLFGSCWGHQFIARVLGGTVLHDPDRAELGTHAVERTAAGAADPLFGALPPLFFAQMGHHDRVATLPPGAVELATNAVAPFQAFRMADAPIYGTQFHSELTVETERARLEAYRAFYPEMGGDAEFQAILDRLRPTPEVDGLLAAFLQRFAVSPTR